MFFCYKHLLFRCTIVVQCQIHHFSMKYALIDSKTRYKTTFFKHEIVVYVQLISLQKKIYIKISVENYYKQQIFRWNKEKIEQDSRDKSGKYINILYYRQLIKRLVDSLWNENNMKVSHLYKIYSIVYLYVNVLFLVSYESFI